MEKFLKNNEITLTIQSSERNGGIRPVFYIFLTKSFAQPYAKGQFTAERREIGTKGWTFWK